MFSGDSEGFFLRAGLLASHGSFWRISLEILRS